MESMERETRRDFIAKIERDGHEGHDADRDPFCCIEYAAATYDARLERQHEGRVS